MRSVLFCPASNARALAKAVALTCDAVIVDLEDAVGGDNKAAARENAEWAFGQGFGAKTAALRVNSIGTAAHLEDLDLARRIKPAALVVPKAEDVGSLQSVTMAFDGPVWLMIETAKGVLNAGALAAAPTVAALILGPNDLRVSLGAEEDPERRPLQYAMSAVVTAARAAGILAFDGVYNNFKDKAGLSEEARQGKLFGFHGKTLIHPEQIDPVNIAYSASADEIERAQKVIAAFNTGGGNAVALDGELIEELHVNAAIELLKREGISR
ncbi:MAG: CoA ester lyase [Pseudomonadota bacterium]